MSRIICFLIIFLAAMHHTELRAESMIAGSSSVCAAVSNSFLVTSTETAAGYSWSITTNTANATLLGATTNSSVEIIATTNGGFTLECVVDVGGTTEMASTNIVVNADLSGSSLTSQTVCAGSDVSFTTEAIGSGSFTFVWRKGVTVLSNAITATLALTNVIPSDADSYCVEIYGPCNAITNCATLTVVSPAEINCPTNLTVACFQDVPMPDTNLVSTSGAVAVAHLGDALSTNGCEITIARNYAAISSCGSTSTCVQTITVNNTNAPVFSVVSNLTVECGAEWTFATPNAFDACTGNTNVNVEITGGTTNALCGNSFVAVRTWTATDACGNIATLTQTISVLDTNAPVLTGVTNRTVECGAAWEFEIPIAIDACSGTNVTLTVVTETNYFCGNTLIAKRTWEATDGCSNRAYFSQTVNVVDTTAPVITCASNRTVECAQAWDFEAPTALDLCGGTNVAITVVGTTTNLLVGETFSATRTWKANDSCSNSSTCSQTITIIDTTPPTLSCSSNVVLECVGPAGTPAIFTTTAWDACDTNVALVCTPPSGSLFALGTNTVVCVGTDDGGNSNVCTFTVTVLDRTPPLIMCPANIIAAEAPRDSGGAVVAFPNPVATDICDDALQLVSSIPSGSIFPVGVNIVTWTATDGSGNTNTCSFTIRVIPYKLIVVTNTDDSGAGSLRQALLDANDSPDENLIYFALPGGGFHTIHLLTALPDLTSPTIIDGWSLSGTNQPPVVALDGSGMSNRGDGLVIRAGPSTVRGLALYGFVNAIQLVGGTNIIQGNYLGLDLTGTNAPGNTGHGLLATSPRNLIGGTAEGTGNIISGNRSNGLTFATANCFSNVVQGNYIGVAVDGVSAVGNGANGILLTEQATRNAIGGSTANQIKFNAASGVALDLTAGSRNSILGNVIDANDGLGIDLGETGITPNDADDSDAGPNDLQNFPILSDARSAAGVTTIEGALTTVPNRTYRIEFFLNNTPDPSGNGEAQVYLGATALGVHGNGPEAFSATLPITLVYTQFITATATDPFGNTSEFSPAVQVRTPPVVELQPVSTNAADGSTVEFCASASGTPPIYYQWRLNGVNIISATNECYTIPAATLANGGTYTVIVRNDLGAFATATASLVLNGANFLNLPVGDNFIDAVNLSQYGQGTNGIVVGDNSVATFEPLEPAHVGKPATHSVWYRWCTPEGSKGIATFRTKGSTFDTLMAVYQGTALSNLVEIASNEDDGGFYSSEVRFNVFYNSAIDTCYYIVVDGPDSFGSLEPGGEFVLSWSEEKTAHMLPVILVAPTSQTVPLGASVLFTNLSFPECAQGHLNCNHDHWEVNYNQKEKLTYQWFYNDQPIFGATNPSYSIPSAQGEQVGNYRVRVFTPWQYLDSKTAVLQINNAGDGSENFQAYDKLVDSERSGPLIIGLPEEQNRGASLAAASTVVRGYSGTQIFNTTGSATAPSEVICGVLGGSSEWISFVAEASGTLFLNTDGSSYDTVMAVYRRSPTNASILELLACDNNSGTNGKTSSLTLPVEAGKTNYVLVDGVNGAVGTLQFNYSLATTTILKVTGRTAEGANQIQVNGRAGLKFILQASTNLMNWSAIVTGTNSLTGTFDYTDMGSLGSPTRLYRALILP